MKDPMVYLITDQPKAQTALCVSVLQETQIPVCVCQGMSWLQDQYVAEGPACIVTFMMRNHFLGMEIHHSILDANIKAPVVILSEAADVPMAVTAIKQGVFDVLSWPIDRKDFQDVVKQAIQCDIERLKFTVSRNELLVRIQSLTPREKEILQLVINGMSSSQIAYKLIRSEKTVKLHRAHMMKKLAFDSAHELVQQLIKLKFNLDHIEQDLVS